eukprot:m.315007 g.315007  ORF g.315007 m.315007 type:complete len:87 (+) comp39265_c0_seq1:301-561(+)
MLACYTAIATLNRSGNAAPLQRQVKSLVQQVSRKSAELQQLDQQRARCSRQHEQLAAAFVARMDVISSAVLADLAVDWHERTAWPH